MRRASVGGNVVFVEEVEQLTDINSIIRAREALAQEELEVNQQLSQLIQQSQMHHQLKLIDSIPEQLDPLIEECNKLKTSLSSTASKAEELSNRVRELDKLRERVLLAMKKTNDIIDLKNCIEGVQIAMSKEDYDVAASHINRYLNIDKTLLDANSAELLATAERNLKDIIHVKLQQAMEDNDSDAILRFCRLYPLLGMPQEAVDKYTTHLIKAAQQDESLVHAEREKSQRQAEQRGGTEKVSYAAAITQLLARIQKRMKRQRATLEAAFGKLGFAQIVVRLQEALNDMALRLVECFEQEWQMQQLVNSIQKQGKQRVISLTRSQPTTEIKDPREYAPMLDQIVLISQTLETNLRFMKALINTPAAKSANQSGELKEKENETEINAILLSLERSYRQSKLNQRVLELLGFYVRLEQYYIDETIRPALLDDANVVPEDSLTSPFVDDVFFVLKESCKRAVLTYNSNSLCAVLNVVVIFLTSTLVDTLAANSQEPTSVRQSLKRPMTHEQILVGLNNVELSCENVVRLKSDVEGMASKIFQNNPQDLQKIGAILDEMLQAEKKLRNVLQVNMEQQATKWITKISSSLEKFGDVTYILTEQEYSQAEINDPFALQFIADLDSALAPTKKGLSPTNYDAFLQVVARHVAEYLETAVFLKKFNNFGAMQFDRDLRNIFEYFAQSSSKKIRDKFARINQIAYILNLETEDEILEHVGEKAPQPSLWKLTPAEMKKVLALRTEFSKDKIARLKL